MDEGNYRGEEQITECMGGTGVMSMFMAMKLHTFTCVHASTYASTREGKRCMQGYMREMLDHSQCHDQCQFGASQWSSVLKTLHKSYLFESA